MEPWTKAIMAASKLSEHVPFSKRYDIMFVDLLIRIRYTSRRVNLESNSSIENGNNNEFV